MTKTKRTGGMVLGILFIGLCVSFLRLSQFGVDPFSAMNLGISGFIGIYRMELWNVAVACQCDHPCSCIFSGKILHWCGDHYQYGICRIHCRLYLLCSE